MSHQLARSRNRNRRQQQALARVQTGGSSNWKSTGAMLLGAAVGGVAIYKGHLVTGTLMMFGGLIGGALLEGKEGA